MNIRTIIELVTACALGVCVLVAPGSMGEAWAQDCSKKVCEELNATYQSSCASSLPDQGRSPQMWFERVSSFSGTHGALMSRKTEMDACVSCQMLYASWERDCTRMEERIAQGWEGHMETASKSYYQFDSFLEKARKRGLWVQGIAYIDGDLVKLRKTLEINAAPGLSLDTAAVDARVATLEGLRAEFQAEHDKQIASVRCPKKGKKNKRHFKTVKAFFLAEAEHAKELKSLRVTGKKSDRYSYSKRTTFETLPVSACVRDDKPAEPKCYVWEMSVQRSRVDGQKKWSGWDTVLVGSQKEMLCKHLK